MTIKNSPKKDAWQKLTDELLAVLDTRSRDIIVCRFGLQDGVKATLESIGKEYGITRERVRQIETQAKKGLGTRLAVLKPAIEQVERLFRTEGGILTKEQLAELTKARIDKTIQPATIYFYLELIASYEFVATDANFAPHWRHPELVAPEAAEVVRAGEAVLHKAKHPMAEVELLSAVGQLLKSTPVATHVLAWLNAARHIKKNPFGEWGIIGWAETTPRGVGDKAYAVLRRHTKPEHFRKIAELINEARFDHKVANAQTVHNELIKDDRFVLVGRGLYGLTEWGYIPGTVADVLEAILKKAEEPLSREELVERVLAQRLVKKNTILLSLQDQSRFVKNNENRYTLREHL